MPTGAGVLRRPGVAPATLLIPVSATVALVQAAQPITDVDSFWHVEIGNEIRSTGRIAGAGDAWAWYDPPDPWVTSQWLSEVAMSWLVDVVGWGALVAATVALSVAFVGLLAWMITIRATTRVAATLFAGVIIPMALAFQVRPALISLVAAIPVAHYAERLLREGTVPPWWLAAPAVIVWSNLHGLWILAPAAFAWAGLLHWLGAPRSRLPVIAATALLVAVLLGAGMLNPLGPRSLVLPFEFRDAASAVLEWQPTYLWGIAALDLVVVLLFIFVAWARTPGTVPATEVLYVLAWAAFGMAAFRNVSVAAVMLVPIAAIRASMAFPRDRLVDSARERSILSLSVSALAIGGLLAVGFQAWRIDPLADAPALAIAQELAGRGDGGTVLNDYNVAGVLVAFGPPEVQVGIDGRTDRYGAQYIADYLDLLALRGQDWNARLADIDPDVAVLEQEAPIRGHLESEGWRSTLADGDYVLVEKTR